MTQPSRCADCDGELEVGFIPDVSMGAALQTAWHRGVPDDKTILDYLKFGPGVKYDRSQLLPVRAFRCKACGLLRLYANDQIG